MRLRNAIERERALWREYPWDRVRWLVKHRRGFLAERTFEVDGTELDYFIHPYNHTWVNERAVEIPLLLRYAGEWNNGDTLEVGNVLSHYFATRHTVIDKYEAATFRPVVNEDLLEARFDRRFSRIVSISTIEHIGWDEDPREPDKVLRVVPRLRSLLAPRGEAIVTVPVGVNPVLDEALPEICAGAQKVVCVRRISHDNEWREATLESALTCRYGEPFYNANAVVLFVLGAPAPDQGNEAHPAGGH